MGKVKDEGKHKDGLAALSKLATTQCFDFYGDERHPLWIKTMRVEIITYLTHVVKAHTDRESSILATEMLARVDKMGTPS